MRLARYLAAALTARYHDSCASLAREIRTQYMLDLAQRLPKEQRWSHKKIGLVLNLTKQRVQQILRDAGKYTLDPNKPVALIPGQGSVAIDVATDARRRKLSRLFRDPLNKDVVQ